MSFSDISSDDLPLAAWGLVGATVTPLSGGTANCNFLVTCAGVPYFLRQRSPRYVEPIQITFDHALMRHLFAHGVRGPNPIPTMAGDTVARRGEAVFELHQFLSGEAVDFENIGHLRIAGGGLRKFHEAAATFVPPVTKDWPRDDAPERIRRGLAELREVIREPGRVSVLDELERWTDRVQRELPDARFWSLPCQIIHGDFHPGNAHVAGDTLGLFDLDCASRQPRARDFADGILYFCARRDGPFDASTIVRLTRECWLEPTRNQEFLEAYGPITPEERAALPWLVAARWIYSRVHGRRKLPKEEWPAYATDGVLTPLRQMERDKAIVASP
ncbi:MAG: phosphotransferase [Candidatus Hydrogenedentes bacterium]|nr:phosphotransferase [Candidatus Hydrogenedentota bacterium]